ncbi:MAG: sensor histidine kinase [Chloroflexi bacterium]|nr:MAG: sensor histidine kinase [Chloroflexota bacterium]
MDKRWRIAAEFGPAVAFTVLSQYEIWAGPIPHMGGSLSGPKPVLSAVVALISLGLALRLRYPLLALVLAMSPFGVHGILEHFVAKGGPNLFEVFLSQVFMVYSTAANTSGRRTYAGAAIVVALQLVGYGPTLPGSFDQASGEWVFYAIAWALGKTLRRRALRGDRLEARTAELEARQQEQIQAAIADERARIARELHDIVAHSVSLMVLQAGAARQALDRQPEKARDPLLSVEATGRTAMSELRRLVAMLRQPEDEDQLAPQPSLRHLNLLVDQIRETGLVIDVDESCREDGIPPGVDLSAYRIAQEALTNVLKHASAAHVSVSVRCDGAAVEVIVEDDGRGPSDHGSLTGGHGIIGMRERVSLFGGRFEAGARAGGGFRVFAHLPYEST